MSQHTIHNMTVNISVTQGDMSEQARGRCIGKMVNTCRAMDTDEFCAAMADMDQSLQGTKRSAALLEKLDEALAENYTPRYSDDFAPIVEISAA